MTSLPRLIVARDCQPGDVILQVGPMTPRLGNAMRVAIHPRPPRGTNPNLIWTQIPALDASFQPYWIQVQPDEIVVLTERAEEPF